MCVCYFSDKNSEKIIEKWWWWSSSSSNDSHDIHVINLDKYLHKQIDLQQYVSSDSVGGGRKYSWEKCIFWLTDEWKK